MSLLPHRSHPFRGAPPRLLLRHHRTTPFIVTTLTPTTSTRPLPLNITVVEPVPAALASSPTRHHIPNDSALKSTWTHRAWVASGCTAVLVSLAKSLLDSGGSHGWLEPALTGFLGYVLADLGTGVYHWGIDNYGGPDTPVFGPQIEAFQGHHKLPWIITKRQFANNLHALARVITFVVLPIDLVLSDSAALAFVGVCSGCIMFSQQFHAWAHGTKSRLPPVVVALQDAGVLVSRGRHAEHHRPPYDNNYCIVSGMWNGVLDRYRVFEAAEMAVFFRYGVRARSWSEPHSEWIEEADSVRPP